MPRSTPATRRHAAPEVRRAQILEAALRCFTERGYHAATMDDVASAAGLSKGSLYWHFDGKEQIFFALFDQVAAEILAFMRSLDAREDRLLEGLREAFAFYMERVLALGTPVLRATVEFLAHPEARARLGAVWAESRAILERALTRAAARGEVSPDADTAAIAAGVVGAAEGLLLQRCADDGFDPRASWPALWDAVARGIRP